jgi:hypothetical protein
MRNRFYRRAQCAHRHVIDVDPLAVELDAARRRYCAHKNAYDPDPMAVGWSRDPRCLNCGAAVNLSHYDADPVEPGLLRRRRQGEAA